ncbi:hypothetical protein Pelo_3412 [Pelomyxa schiedti]|nr:hypothetical protein Pelo_3412 [Pelomyxa schiedti]
MAIMIPRGNIKLRLMQNHHDDLKGGGHRSGAKMHIAMYEKYWWPTMFQDLKEWVKSCPECQRFRKHKPSYQPKSILATEPNDDQSSFCTALNLNGTSKILERTVSVVAVMNDRVDARYPTYLPPQYFPPMPPPPIPQQLIPQQLIPQQLIPQLLGPPKVDKAHFLRGVRVSSILEWILDNPKAEPIPAQQPPMAPIPRKV